MKRTCPMESSTLFPKIHRYSMFPIRCIQPPCRNMELSTVMGGEASASSAGNSAPPRSRAGMNPSPMMTACCACGGSETVHKNASEDATIKLTVTMG